jgi:anti-anti-sigma factor
VNLSFDEQDIPDVGIVTVVRENALWVSIRGEVDLSNHTRLGAGLANVALDGAHVVHLRLSELTFCDLHGVRHLLAFAERVRGTGGEISIHGASRTVQMMTSALGSWDGTG